MLTVTPEPVRASDIRGRFWPFGRYGHKANVVVGGILPSLKFVNGRRSNMLDRMRAARPIFGRNMRPFDVKGLHRFALQASRYGASLLWLPPDSSTLPRMRSGDPVITVAKNRVTPVVNMVRTDSAIDSVVDCGSL